MDYRSNGTNALIAWVSRIDKQNLGNKALTAFLLLIALWNLTKLPFLMAFGNDGNSTYNDHGIELSINLGHWIKGFRSSKMRTPPCNFLLVHAALGITVVIMMVLTLIRKAWRKKYCKPFFIFAILEGIHAIPASLVNDAGLTPLFLFACALLIGSGVWGLKTNQEYDHDPSKAEKNLLIQYSIVAGVNSAAAFLETPKIIEAFKYHDENGVWKNFGDAPHKSFGHTLYDTLPEKVGMGVFLIFCTTVWFIWPLLLLNVEKEDPKDEIHDNTAGETTLLL